MSSSNRTQKEILLETLEVLVEMFEGMHYGETLDVAFPTAEHLEELAKLVEHGGLREGMLTAAKYLRLMAEAPDICSFSELSERFKENKTLIISSMREIGDPAQLPD